MNGIVGAMRKQPKANAALRRTAYAGTGVPTISGSTNGSDGSHGS